MTSGLDLSDLSDRARHAAAHLGWSAPTPMPRPTLRDIVSAMAIVLGGGLVLYLLSVSPLARWLVLIAGSVYVVALVIAYVEAL